MKKRLDGILKIVACYQQCELKELTGMTVRENVMQPKLWNTKDSIEKECDLGTFIKPQLQNL